MEPLNLDYIGDYRLDPPDPDVKWLERAVEHGGDYAQETLPGIASDLKDLLNTIASGFYDHENGHQLNDEEIAERFDVYAELQEILERLQEICVEFGTDKERG